MIAVFAILSLLLSSCRTKNKEKSIPVEAIPISKPIHLFGYNLDQFQVTKDTILEGETFGTILDKFHVIPSKVYNIAHQIQSKFDVRKLRAGKNYTILSSKDSIQKAQIFIYQHDLVNYSVVDFKDSIFVKTIKKEITTKLKTTSGIIKNNLSASLEENHVNYTLAHKLSNIYAWSIDFFRLQKEDKYKVIYEQKYIEDTIPVGLGRIKAAYFEHAHKPFYAFYYSLDSVHQTEDYFDETAKELKSPFLKAPLKFSRISSRYNVRRRIKLYGNRIKPHLGTDFAAPIGSPIMATANGRVIASTYRGGNGNYVKVRHNATYSTQYLHMKKRKVKVGDYVKQGDVIGWVGMTGNTSGPHVCYRFWKNGKQVDPLKEKMPEAKPLKKELKPDYFKYIANIKQKLDSIPYESIALK